MLFLSSITKKKEFGCDERSHLAFNATPEEEFKDIDILFERIIALDRIEKAEKNISGNKVYTTDKAKQKLSK